MRGWKVLLPLLVLTAIVLAACGQQAAPPPQTGQEAAPAASPTAPQTAQSRLDIVLARGRLICGVNGGLPGFSYVEPDGRYSGLDADFCRAIAAALFDDPNAVEFRNLTAAERFAAVQNGEVDVLIRNTTWTVSRDTSVGMEFAPTIFYDGQGMMVRKDSGITRLEDFQGKSVCVQTGTTTELNLADWMRRLNVAYEPVVYDSIDATYEAYAAERCDGVTSDRSQLMARRTVLPNPDEHVILDVVMSKEPLTPAVAQGDARWFDVVKWVVFATMEAEELGVSSRNIGQMLASDDPQIKRFLGREGDLGTGLGLTNDFVARIIRHVGNYGEIYDRNLGPDTPFKLDRGPNDLWTRGGLIYSPPFR